MKLKKVIATLLGAAMLTVSVAGCGGDSKQAGTSGSAGSGSDENKLVVYCPHPLSFINPLVEEFEKESGIKVEVVAAGTGELLKRVESEKANPLGDIFWGGSLSTMKPKANLFEPYKSANEDHIQEAFKNTEGSMTRFTDIPSVIMVNTDLIGDIKVEGYEDLLNPALKGKIANADPTSSSSAFAHLCNILLAMGDGENPYTSDAAWNYVESLIGQLNHSLTSGSSAVYKGVGNGEYVVGLSYEIGVAGFIRNGAQGVHTVYPTEGVCWTPVGSAIVKGAKNMDNAKLFMDWLISDECQTIMAEKTVCRGVRTDLFKATEYMPSFDTLNLKQENEEYTSANKQTIVDHWTELWTK